MLARLMVAMALLLLVAPGEAYHTALAPAVGRRVGSGIHMGGKKAKYGLFSPIVQGARAVMGEQELLCGRDSGGASGSGVRSRPEAPGER